MPNQILLLALSVLILLGACSSSTPERATPSPSQSSAPVASPSPRPAVALDGSETKLPKAFIRDDIERVYDGARQSGKSEFETTVAYQTRLENEARDRPFAFEIEPFVAPNETVVYDADRARIVMRLWVKRDPTTTDINEDSITLPIRNKVKVDTYTASNAFGASVEVRRTSEVAHALAVVPVPVSKLHQQQKEYSVGGYARECLEFYLPMSAQEAKQRKEHLRFILLAKPATRTKARTFTDNYEWKATVTSPTARYTETNAVYVDVSSVHILMADIDRGDILAKARLAEVLKLGLQKR